MNSGSMPTSAALAAYSAPKAFMAIDSPPEAEPVMPATMLVETASETAGLEDTPKAPSRMMAKAGRAAMTAP
ncbi:hypothetical protein G6F62_015964 [Rhizopus arrhizus]|nr:hypothetical protein G6F62_015964 [Rhizopus arrhizus]